MIAFWDTETTGLLNQSAPPADPSQPEIVQFGALLTDDDGREQAAINCLVQPNGWKIPEAATRVHGITTEDCVKAGIDIRTALVLFSDMVSHAHTVVAHNLKFDRDVTSSQCARYGIRNPLAFYGPKEFCTMQAATNIVRIPNPRYAGKFKWPSLNETHRHFFGTDVVGAHDAMADVRACARCYFEMHRINKEAA